MCLNTWFPDAQYMIVRINSLKELHHTILLAERISPELCCNKLIAFTFNLRKLEIIYETAK